MEDLNVDQIQLHSNSNVIDEEGIRIRDKNGKFKTVAARTITDLQKCFNILLDVAKPNRPMVRPEKMLKMS